MLSVIVPAADSRLANLNLVLTSLAAQTLPREMFEVIVVSDGGQDSFADVLKMHAALRPLFVRQPKHDPLLGAWGERLRSALPDTTWAINAPEALQWQNEHRAFFIEMVSAWDARRDALTMQPRNRGARNARFPFLIFADSDVVLHPRALEYYAEDFSKNPNRIVCGLYHWLAPMRVSPADVRQRFDSILDERLPRIELANPHSVMRDPRAQTFAKYSPDHTFCPATPAEKYQQYPAYLNMFSGNIGYPAELFWRIGGYWNALAAGAHEDGASGVAACSAGIPLSFDERIVGGHINHAYNFAYRARLWLYEIPLINARFQLGDFNPGTGEMHDQLPSLQEMSDENLRWLGVWDWDPARAGAG